MPCCEKCWADAALKSLSTHRSQTECYFELLKERKDNPCTPREQAGEWWDEEKKCDKRFLIENGDG